jgi:murein DD-endopeptidase MepM/ murein hydrolase activator NlpD
MLLSVLLTFVIILGVSLFRLNQYQTSQQASESEYEKLLGEYNILETKANELTAKLDMVEYKNDSAQLTLNRQAAKLNEQDAKYTEEFDEFSKKTEELQQQLETLEKAKQEIIDQLNKIPYLPGITDLTLDEPIPLAVSYSSDPIQMLSYKLDSISNIARSELSSYQSLTETFEEIKPVLNNYPSIWPVKGITTSGFGRRQSPMGGNSSENHTGLDIAVPMYTDVKATGGGTITTAEYSGGYGYLIVIDHGMGLATYYGHNAELLASVGDSVARGQIVAKSGNTGNSTGPHVHYEVRVNGKPVNPVKYVTLSD